MVQLITPMPPDPSRSMPQETFDKAVVARLVAERQRDAEYSNLSTEVNANTVAAAASAAAAQAKALAADTSSAEAAGWAVAAGNSALTAAAVSGAATYSALTAYAPPASGSIVPSAAVGADGQTYRCIAATTGGADPSEDPAHWTRVTGNLVGQKSITAAYTITRADHSSVLEFNGSFTVAFAPQAALGKGFSCVLRNVGTGDVLLDPYGTETIDLVQSYPMLPGEVRFVYQDATTLAKKTIIWKAWRRAVGVGFVHTWTPGYAGVNVDLVGGSGGAGSGAKGNSTDLRQGGSPGGTPARVKRFLAALAVGTTEAVYVGSGGSSGGQVTADNTNGYPGTDGGNTTWGSRAIAYGGVGGVGGQANISGSGLYYCAISGSGALGKGATTGWVTNPAAYAIGGAPCYVLSNLGIPGAVYEEGGATAYANGGSGNAIYGGGSASSGNVSAGAGGSPGVAGSSHYGVPGGGWGASINTTLALGGGRAGKTGGWNLLGALYGSSSVGAAGTAGANGTSATNDDEVGNSGGGGGAAASAGYDAGRGGDGGWPGGAPGGGGACTNGSGNSGAGGQAASGRVVAQGVIA